MVSYFEFVVKEFGMLLNIPLNSKEPALNCLTFGGRVIRTIRAMQNSDMYSLPYQLVQWLEHRSGVLGSLATT